MAISIHCTSCKSKLKCPSKLAGKTINCPKCGQKVLVTELKSGPSPTINSNFGAPELQKKRQSLNDLDDYAAEELLAEEFSESPKSSIMPTAIQNSFDQIPPILINSIEGGNQNSNDGHGMKVETVAPPAIVTNSDWGSVVVGTRFAIVGYLMLLGSYTIQKIAYIWMNIAFLNLADNSFGKLLYVVMFGAIIMSLSLICLVVGQACWISVSKERKSHSKILGICSLSTTGVATLLFLFFSMIPSFSFVATFRYTVFSLDIPTQRDEAILFIRNLLTGPLVFNNPVFAISTILGFGASLVFSSLNFRAIGQNLNEYSLSGNSTSITSCAAGFLLVSVIISSILQKNVPVDMDFFSNEIGLIFPKEIVRLFLVLQLIEFCLMAMTIISLIKCSKNLKNLFFQDH